MFSQSRDHAFHDRETGSTATEFLEVKEVRVMRKQNRISKAISLVAAALLALYLVPATAFAASDDTAAQEGVDDTSAALVQVTTADGTKTSYATLEEAVDAAPAGSTVTLLADQEVSDILSIKQGITLDGNGHTLTAHSRGVYLYGGDDEAHSAAFVLKNLTITNPDAYGRVLSTRDGYKSLRLEDVKLVATGAGNTQVLTIGGNTPQTTDIAIVASTLTASKAGYGIITFNPVDLTIADSQISGYAALYMKGPDSSAGSTGSKVTITDGSILSGDGIPGVTNNFGTIVFQGCDDIDMTVDHSTINADSPNENPPTTQAVLLYSSYPGPDTTPASNNTVTFKEGTTVNTTGTYSALASGNGQKNTVAAKDGTFHLGGSLFDATQPEGDDPAQGTNLVVTGGSWNKDVAPYAPAGYTEQRTGGDGDAPFTVSKATPTTPDTPATPDQPTNPDTPSTPDTPGTTDQGTSDDSGTTTGSETTHTDEGTQTDDGTETHVTDNPLADHNGGTNITHATDTEDEPGTTAGATSSTPTVHRTSTATSYPSRTASVPQTGDPLTQAMALAGAVALMAALVAGASLIHRKRASN
ncbi:hypothetical protein [uncultured Adlercreutzia sp.]|uniref:pectate lyase-like adhesive domain-containing protein n=1 Tax=uncultured Adlercreutzia sp. TaxID=875803 RepID=UPI0025E34B26|nr:hypothetical protein [uncultured Adlercreutzia sp.]